MPSTPPTRVLAGVPVPDTPLITKALAFARAHCDDFTYNHVVRSWLFGTYICDHIPSLKDRDVELHAITAILHDMGWAISGDIISKDKRFEVDGAEATRAFLIREGEKDDWDARRLQLAWDTVALHTTVSIAMYKEVEVRGTSIGVMADFAGPERAFGGVLTREVWERIITEFPRLGFRDGIKRVLCGLCQNKPETTYDNFVMEFGTAYVEGYSVEGRTFLDILAAAED